MDQKTILGLGERVSGGNWFSFVKEQSLPDWIQVTQIEHTVLKRYCGVCGTLVLWYLLKYTKSNTDISEETPPENANKSFIN